MRFSTQRELLEYAGKNPNDRSLIQRWKVRGKVYVEDGMYVLVEDDIDSVRRENEELKEKLKKKSEWADSEELANYKKWLDEANAAYEELEAQSKAEIEGITKRCWDYMVQRKCCPTQTKQEFEYWILGKEYKDIQFSPDELPF